MLVKSDYESWKIRIERYIRVTESQGAAALQVTRDKMDEEFNEIENIRDIADIQATNILSQGLPRHVFNILNQTRTGKEIWDNVELLMKGTRGTQSYGQVTDNKGKLVICYNCRREGHVSRQCKEKKRAKIAQPTLYDSHALLKTTNTSVRVHDREESLVQAEVSRTKMSNRPGIIKPINYAELNVLYSHFVPQKEPLDENLVKEVTEFMQIFDELDKEYEQCVLEKKKLQIEKKNILIQNEFLVTDCIEKDICSIVLASDRDRPFSEELRSNYVRENSKVIKLEAKILKHQQMLAELDKRCSFDKQALETELTELKDAITSVRIQNDGFKVENVNLKRHYQELSTSNSHSRDTLTRKLTALTAENAKLKSESLRKMHSKPIVPEKPKVLAPGMIVEPIIEPLELTPCVSSNYKVTMISRFTDYKLSNRKAGSKGISGSLN
nr:hypothetical protein [Tanacetum cinerariifolium]